MKILVIGARGQVAEALRERGGAEVVAFGRPEVDLAAPETIRTAFDSGDWDAVVNAAAYTAVDKAEAEEAIANKINAEGAGEAARLAEARAIPFLHLSTDYVFDGRLDRPYREDDPVNPLSAYGRSKLAGERAVAAAAPGSTILRTSWVYSPYGTNFLKTMLRIGAANATVRVVADQVGAPTSALDIADAILRVVRARFENPADVGQRGIFHMTGAGEASWAEFAEEIFATPANWAAHLSKSAASRRRNIPRRRPDPRIQGWTTANLPGLSICLANWRQSRATA